MPLFKKKTDFELLQEVKKIAIVDCVVNIRTHKSNKQPHNNQMIGLFKLWCKENKITQAQGLAKLVELGYSNHVVKVKDIKKVIK